MNSEPIHFTETNSSDDSQGRTWGLEGNLFWFMIGGAFAFVVTLLLLFSALRMSLTLSALIGSIPFVLVSVYVFGFRQGKPPGYDRDYLDLRLHGPGFGPELVDQPQHPLKHVRESAQRILH